VKDFSLIESPDSDVWDRAKKESLAIISKDDDFVQRSFLFGHPPKVILLGVGNCGTRDLITFIKSKAEIIHSFINESKESLLVLKR
jgi:predicted nuclease of predicted toxin-antitoxin system